MGFLETVEKARAFLERNGRVSLRALQRESGLGDDGLDELIEELVEIQRVAVRDGRTLVWKGVAPGHPGARAPRDYTPRHLAEKILRSRSALEGERKRVSVLFADVKGSMELSGQLGAEEWHGILERFFAVLTEGVHRFEGTVNQYTGDGIMALFGAPIAHEDHAQRACYAALWLRDALKRLSDELRLSRAIDFAVRMGIHTGEVVVGKIGDDLRMDYTAQGVTVGLAQRLEQMAATHSVYLSEATAQLVAGYVELRELGEATVKGMPDAVRVFELVGPGSHRTRLDVAESRGLTRFVGRDADLAVLAAALEQAVAGEGQVVGVVAEAGVGKSRLCLEFLRRCRARGIRADEGRCPPHGKTVPYLPLLELLRSVFGIAERDDDAEARRKITDELRRLDASLLGLLPLAFDFLRVPDAEHALPPMGADLRRRQLVALLRQLVKALGAREPRVLLVDDAHWIDAGSDELLAELIAAASGTRVLVVVNFRPEYHAAWMGRSGYRQLPLLPLGIAGTRELLGDLLGSDTSVAGLSDAIHERTRGNPFFVEEVVRSLVESGRLEGVKGAFRLAGPVEDLAIPESVQSVLSARIDRLAEREKHLLQTASVIGREVPGPLLERVAALADAERRDALDALVSGEFLLEKALFPEAAYAFKHPLTQEMAYRSQLAGRRAERHAVVARAIEELAGDRLDEQAPLLAYHWERAGEPLTAARWTVRAARYASLDAPFLALRYWEAARALAGAAEGDEGEELELEACTGLLGVASWFRWFRSPDEVVDLFTRSAALAERRSDRRALCHLHLHYAVWHGLTRYDTAAFARHAQRAADLAVEVGDEGAGMAAAAGLTLAAYTEGRLLDAIDLGRRALAHDPTDPLGSEYWSPPPVIWLQGMTHFFQGLAGRPAEGLAALEQLLDTAAHMRGGVTQAGISRLQAVHLADLLGDAPAALGHAQRMWQGLQELAGGALEGTGIEAGIAYCAGLAHLADGDGEAAVRRLERAVAILEQIGGGPPLENLLAPGRLAEAYALAGQPERALETAERALALVRAFRMPAFIALTLTLRARVLRIAQGAEARNAIDAALSEAEALVETTGIRAWQPFLHVERAELAGLLGDAAARERELREAYRLFSEMGAAGHAARLAAELRA
jgi:class 3 adenylate cyclase/tetratricopeptide (TPR) repeat protein